LLGLIVLGVPVLILALIVRQSSRGPGFFRQTRVGLRRSTFQIIKIRTMRDDAEPNTTPIWAVDNDSRCTPLGGYLRRYGIDELPQLWNVLRGDMSLVGPRPERPEFQKVFEFTIPGFAERLRVRGGLTGLAQVRGWRGDTSVEERFKADLEYIEKWSIWKDLLILLRTPLFLLRQGKTHVAAAPYASNCLESNSR
jgi:lipopolysaccharide/colanic/teichoic acid biosynthesis glycosyltransferase